MNAQEARKISVMNQYTIAQERIAHEANFGRKSCLPYLHGALYSEVAEMLAKEGYNVKTVFCRDDSRSYMVVSWDHAVEGEFQEGTVTVVYDYETAEDDETETSSANE